MHLTIIPSAFGFMTAETLSLDIAFDYLDLNDAFLTFLKLNEVKNFNMLFKSNFVIIMIAVYLL